MKLMLYNLIEVRGEVKLNIGLTKYLLNFDKHFTAILEIELPDTDLITLNKFDYLNKGKVLDTGKVAFIVATKSFSNKQAKKLLLQHACTKIETRLAHWENRRDYFKKLLAA